MQLAAQDQKIINVQDHLVKDANLDFFHFIIMAVMNAEHASHPAKLVVHLLQVVIHVGMAILKMGIIVLSALTIVKFVLTHQLVPSAMKVIIQMKIINVSQTQLIVKRMKEINALNAMMDSY